LFFAAELSPIRAGTAVSGPGAASGDGFFALLRIAGHNHPFSSIYYPLFLPKGK